MEKYGFVYIWFDKKHKRYYVGAHWGTETDGYVCSSPWMMKAHSRRPQDFKRRILERGFSNRKETFLAEEKYLDLIKKEEFGKKYYNLKNIKGHWSTSNEKMKTLKQKISIKTKEAMASPEVRQKYLEGLSGRNNRSADPEVIAKRSKSMKETMLAKFPIETRKVRLPKDSPELLEVYRQRSVDMWQSRTEEGRKEIGNKISDSQTGKPKTGRAAKGHKKSPEHIEKIRQSNIGKKRSKESVEKTRQSNIGRKHSEESKAMRAQRMKELWALRKAALAPMPNYNRLNINNLSME